MLNSHIISRLISADRYVAQAFCSALFSFAGATTYAAPPALGTWVELDLRSCQVVTFLAPTHDSPDGMRYATDASVRLTLLTGTVRRAASFNGDGSLRGIPLQSLQPRRGEALAVVSEDYRCPAAVPSLVNLVYAAPCDTGPLAGACIAPFPAAKVVGGPGKWKWVEGSER